MPIHEESSVHLVERLAFALSAAGIGTWNLDPVTRRVEWDERCRELYGFPPEEEVSYDYVLKNIAEEDRDRVRNAVAQALDPDSGGSYNIQFRTIGAVDQQLRWIHCIGRAFFNTNGVPYRFSGTAQDITQSVADREKATISEKIAEVALENSNSGYFRVLLDTQEIDYSSGFARILTGDERKELSRQDFVLHIHPEDRIIRKKAYEVAHKTGKLDYETRIIWNDGSVHWMRAKGAYIYDSQRKPYLLTGTIYDTSAEHQQNEALSQAENLLATAFNNASMGMAFLDLSGYFLKVNSAYVDLFGYTEEELQQVSYRDLTYEHDQKISDTLFNSLINRERTHYNLVKRYVHKAGAIQWVQINVTLIRNASFQEDRILVMARDISSEVEQEKALAVSENLFKNVTKSSPTGLWLSDPTGKLLYCNEKFSEWIGIQSPLELDREWLSQISNGFIPQQHFQKAINSRSHFDVVFQMGHTSTQTIWCRLAGDPYFDEHGEYAGYSGFCMDVDELISGQQALQNSEARFRSLIEEAPVATCLFVGKDMRIEVANDTMIGYWGKDSSVFGKPLIEAVPELIGQPFLDILQQVYETGQTHQSQSEPAQLAVGGELRTFYFNFTYKPLLDASGQVYAIMDMAIDVTEQVLAQKELEESELFSRSIIDHSPIAKLVLVGEDLVVKTVNARMAEILGRQSPIIGLKFIDAVPELAESHSEILRNVLLTGTNYYQPEEKVELFRNGKSYVGYYHYVFKALSDTSGKRYGIIITANEVTEQVQARQRIEEAESTLRSAVELANLGMWQINLDTEVFEFSNRLRTWFSLEPDEIITIQRALQAIDVDDQDGLIQTVMALANSEGPYEAEFRVTTTNPHRKRILHALGKTLFDQDGKAYKISGTVQDVTDQRMYQLSLEQEVQQRTEELRSTNAELAEANERLVHSNEELAQYTYVASHDLQEPLRKIRMFSGMLENQAGVTPDQQRLISKVTQSSERMLLLIRDLLEFSRLLKSDSLMTTVNLSGIISSIITDFELTIEEKKARISVGPLPEIEAVQLQMNQLFYNLVGNALKFSRPDTAPELRIESRLLTSEEMQKLHIPEDTHRKYHQITFSDNGIGFESQYSEGIFEVFKRLHSRESYPGSGIGLALCRRIVVNHHGFLYAESSPGQGSTFYVIVPENQ